MNMTLDRHNNQWVGLTLDEKHYLKVILNLHCYTPNCARLQGQFSIIEAIESKLKNKNNEPQKWVGLTRDEKHDLNDILNLEGRFPIIDAIESKLKYKNIE